MSQPLGILTAAAQFGLESVLIKPKRGLFIAGASGNNPSAYTPGTNIVAQVTIEESHKDDLEITEHPVEIGASITDHAFKRPAELTLKLGWSNSPSQGGLIDGLVGGQGAAFAGVQSLLSGNAVLQVRDIYNKLLALQTSAVPFDIYTGKRKYTNMLIASLTTSTDKDTENSLMVSVSCKQIIIVGTSLVSVPAPATQQIIPASTAATANNGTKSLLSGGEYSNAGDGRGFINPPLIVP